MVSELLIAKMTASKRINYKIKSKPLTILGLPLNYGLAVNVFLIVGTIGVAWF